MLEAIREVVGGDFPLMYDPGYMYDYKGALWVGKRLEEFHLAWFESPMMETDGSIPAYAKLCEQLTVPICAPESNPDYHFGRGRYLRAGATDINRIDSYYGGFTACLKTAAMCQAAGMRLELHATPINSYTLQVLGASGEETIEYLEEYDNDPEGGENYVGGKAPFPFLKSASNVIDSEGYAHIPHTPGAGIDPDWDYIYQHRV